jgi:hypothetical protein
MDRYASWIPLLFFIRAGLSFSATVEAQDVVAFEPVRNHQPMSCQIRPGKRPGEVERVFEIGRPSWSARSVSVHIAGPVVQYLVDFGMRDSVLVASAARRSAAGLWSGFHTLTSAPGMSGTGERSLRRALTDVERRNAEGLVKDLLSRPCPSP